MSPENPLKHFSDDEIVTQHCNAGANTHYLSEMIRRLKVTLESHGKKILWLTLALLLFTIVIAALTAVLVWTNF
jgi:hypothetical protein